MALFALSNTCIYDSAHGDLIKNGLRISLSKREALLMYYLIQDLGHPVSTEKLIYYVWGSNRNDGISMRNSLYKCVHQIRERLEDDVHNPVLLLPVKGYGYMLRTTEFITVNKQE